MLSTSVKQIFEKSYFWFSLFLGLILMVMNLTTSPLWVDEVVEYYYSTVIVGPVIDTETLNMYDRIRETFQPPLYNVLMCGWLSICDAEWWFRLFSVIITAIGAIGLYRCVLFVTNKKLWSSVSMLMYMMTPCIYQYSLECAEYPLMLAMLCWTIFYFLKCNDSATLKNIVLFFVFGVLAVYSQYGAALAVVALYIALFAGITVKKHKRPLIEFITCSIATFVVAALPLMVFFLFPQMEHQGTLATSHSLYFATGSFFSDFVQSMEKCVEFTIDSPRLWLFIIVVSLFLLSVIANVMSKNQGLRVLSYCAISVLLIYYFLVAASIYGYVSPEKIGTQNVAGRYFLFYVPMLSIVILTGTFQAYKLIGEKYKSAANVMICALVMGFFCLFLYKVVTLQKKEDVRDIVVFWSEKLDKTTPLFIDEWEYMNFMFYIDHILPSKDSSKDVMISEYIRKNGIENSGMLDHDKFYLIIYPAIMGPRLKTLEDHGYKYTIIYDGISAMVEVEKAI